MLDGLRHRGQTGGVTDLLLIAVFILAYGAMGSVLGLSGTLWLKFRERKLLKTLLFLVYLTLLFLFSGFRFGLDLWTDPSGPVFDLISGFLERLAYAAVIYFLPATINYILGRSWTAVRLVRTGIAALIYLVSGMASLFSGGAAVPGMLAVLAFLFIVLFILVDASRSLPMVKDEVTRTSLFLIYGLTFVYLPLEQVLPLLVDGYDRGQFLVSSLYYLAAGITANIIFYRALILNGPAARLSDEESFQESCRESGLTPRECEIASLISRGSTYKEIGVILSISPNTVSNHVTTIYRKTGTRSKVEMVNVLRGR